MVRARVLRETGLRRKIGSTSRIIEASYGSPVLGQLLKIPYHGILSGIRMAHVIQNKKKLLARISRIRGQINGIEKALNEERECGEVLLTLAACRGAMNALMAEILEGHVRLHLMQTDSKKDPGKAEAAEELIEVIKRYLK
jgi:FrmR/RcnR family transcriptional regulator, repressor of frmRAB operon